MWSFRISTAKYNGNRKVAKDELVRLSISSKRKSSSSEQKTRGEDWGCGDRVEGLFVVLP